MMYGGPNNTYEYFTKNFQGTQGSNVDPDELEKELYKRFASFCIKL